MTSGSPGETKRLFVGIQVPGRMKDDFYRLHTINHRLKGIRWVSKATMHITACFIGETDPAMLEDIIGKTAVIATGTKPFTLEFEAFCLKPDDRPYMVWARFGQTEAFNSISRQLCEALIPGQKSRKEPIPHVTLARFNRPQTGTSTALEPEISDRAVMAEELILWQSIRDGDGIVYKVLKQFRLED